MNRRRLENFTAIAFLTILVVYRFREGALLKVVYSLGDIGSEFLPIRMAAAEAFRRFQFLLWSPEILGGYPTYAHPHTAAFYPLNWLLALLLPSWATVNYFVLLHLALIAAFMFLLLRFLGLSSLACVLGSVVFTLNTNRISDSYLFLGPIAWLPLVVLLVEKAFAEREPRYMLLAVLFNGLGGVAGSPPMTFVINVGFLIYVVLRLLPRLRPPNLGRFAAGVLFFFLLSFGLMAVQALPTREFARLSSRATPTWDFITQGSLDPAELPLLVTRHSFVYLGAIPAGLAVLGLLSSRNRRTARVLGVLTLISLLLCLGKYTPLYRVLFAYAPGFAKFRIPQRFFVWVTFGIAALAAIGLETLLDWARRRPGRGLVGVTAATVLISAVILDYDRIDRYQYEPSRAIRTEDLRSPVDIARWIQQEPERYRVLPEVTKVNVWSSFAAKRQLLEGNSPLLAHVDSSAGYMPLHYVPYMNMFNRLDHVDGAAKLRLASFLNVRYLVTDADYPPGFPPGRLVFRAATREGVRLFLNPQSLPRVIISNSLLIEPDTERAAGLLLTGEWDPRTRLQVANAEALLGAPCGSPLRATVTRFSYGATRIEIDARTNCRALLCLLDNFYPGWVVSVDAQTAPLVQTDLIYRGVPLHTGDNHVVFQYKPRWLWRGVAISVLTLALVGLALAWTPRLDEEERSRLTLQ